MCLADATLLVPVRSCAAAAPASRASPKQPAVRAAFSPEAEETRTRQTALLYDCTHLLVSILLTRYLCIAFY